MKTRILSLILALCIFMTGCSFLGNRINTSTTFYYLCDRYQKDLCCVIVSEERETSGHEGDLSYLLALYLMGPTVDEHIMPLPAGTRISAQKNGGKILLKLTNPLTTLSDVDFTLACACLTMTCLEITDADDVTIRFEDRERTMNRDQLTLYDTSAETTPLEESE